MDTTTEKPEPQQEKPKSVSLGKEITNNDIWMVMSIRQFGTSYVITEVTNAGIHSLVRTVTQKTGEVIHTSMTLIPNFAVREITDAQGKDKVVFIRGI